MASLYHDLILDHYRNPRNRGTLPGATHRNARNNPTCGDRLAMEVIVKDGILADIRFDGSGCAISQAAASLLTAHVKNQPLSAVFSLGTEDVLALLGVPLSPTRLKCALLSLETLHQALLPPDEKR